MNGVVLLSCLGTDLSSIDARPRQHPASAFHTAPFCRTKLRNVLHGEEVTKIVISANMPKISMIIMEGLYM